MKKENKDSNKQSISQLEIARVIAKQERLSLEVITRIIETEQKLTMMKVQEGFRVVKKNYLILEPYKKPAKTMFSKLTNKSYVIPARTAVRVTVGNGFKTFVNPHKRMKEKICRFVDGEKKSIKNQEKGA